MDNIRKEHIISGVVGGVATLLLAFALRKSMRKLGFKRRWNFPPPTVTSVSSDKLPPSIGPFSAGKKIAY